MSRDPFESTAQGEFAERNRLAEAIARLLDGPAEPLAPFVESLPACARQIDFAAIFAMERDHLALRAGAGLHLPSGQGDLLFERESGLGQILSQKTPITLARPELSPLKTFAEGVKVAHAIVLSGMDRELLGLGVFGSRSASALGDDDLVLARIVAERVARVFEVARLAGVVTRAESALAGTDRFRDQILAVVGHDLRNPLGAVMMSASLLQKKGDLHGWQAKAVARVRSATLRMGRIIEDLLSFTRVRLGTGIPIARSTSDLGERLLRTVENLQASYPAVQIRFSVAGDLAGRWDGDRVEQAVSIMSSSLIDSGDESDPIEIAIRGEGETVRLSVTSRGELPTEALRQVFEPSGPEVEYAGKGSALGLGPYVARKIAAGHGGTISIRSEPGMTSIEMELPRKAD